MSIISSLGTVVQETSNFLVEEKIVSTNTTSLTFSNLDVIRDGGYEIEILGINNYNGNTDWQLLVNNDTTLTNYYSVWMGAASNSSGTPGWYTGSVPCKFVSNGLNIPLYGKGEIVFNRQSGTTLIFSSTKSMYNANTTNAGFTGFHEHKIAQTNIISLTLSASQVNAIGAGTIVRLYRKKQGIPSAFPSAQGMLVADIVVPTATTQINITGLNGNLHGGYVIHSDFINATSNANQISLYFNEDNTATEYYSQQFNITGSSTNPVKYNSSRYTILDASSSNYNVCYLSYYNGKIRAINQSLRGSSSTLSIDFEYIHKINTVSNLSSLSFIGNVPSGIAAGSRIQIYRNK